MKVKNFDMAIKNGIVVRSREIQCADFMSPKVKLPASNHPAADVIDAKGKLVMPGIIDAHLHPVYADRIETLSQAAACEGITTLITQVLLI